MCQRECREKGKHAVGGNVEWYSYFGKQYGDFFEK